MTIYTAERIITVDGTAWVIRGVRNQASCWGQAREHLTTALTWIEIDLDRVDPDDTAYDLPDDELLDVVARAAPTAIRKALRLRSLGRAASVSVGL